MRVAVCDDKACMLVYEARYLQTLSAGFNFPLF